MSRKNKKRTGFLGWGWNPEEEKVPHGVERMKEVRKRVGADHGAGSIIEMAAKARDARLAKGDFESSDEYKEAVERGLWDNGTAPKKGTPPVQPSLLEQPTVAEAIAAEKPSYYISQGGKLIPVFEVDGDEEESFYSGKNYYDKHYYDRYSFGRQYLGESSRKSTLSEEDRTRLSRYKEGGLGSAYDSYNYEMEEYKKSGVWGGYTSYRAPTLSYRYIEQMANVLAAHYGIEISMGDDWEVDIENKKLTYNPLSLTSGTKADLLLTLLHEIGHIINTKPSGKIKVEETSPFKWDDPIGKALFEIPNVFEDTRNDQVMRTTYSGADEIYESAQEAPVRALAMRISKYGDAIRRYWVQEEQRFLQEVQSQLISLKEQMKVRPQDEARIKRSIVDTIDDAFRTLPTEAIGEIGVRAKTELGITDAEREKRSELPNAFDFAAASLLKAYGYEPKSKAEKMWETELKPYLDKTEGFFEGMKMAKNTQEMFNLMEANVTPEIKVLIDRIQFPPTLKDQVSGKTAARMRQNLAQAMQMQGETAKAGQQNTRTGSGSGPGNAMPADWMSGDYNALRDSVRNETKKLERFLQNIRREDQAVRMTRYERRGHLDSRSLYKFATGSQRLFKRKLPNIDTVRSFAFSLVVDTSGSMQGDSIINSTRAMIALAEAFETVGIPTEIMKFDTNAAIIKGFDIERMDKKTKGKIGGLVKAAGGSTNIDQAFKTTKMLERKERNRIMVVISDGGVGDSAYIKHNYVDEFKKQGVQTFGFALDGCVGEIERMCESGCAFSISTPAKMVPAFEDLVKKLMRTARSQITRVN